MSGVGKVGAVFEAFVFEPKDVEVPVESPASPVAALRVALDYFFVDEAFETLRFFSLVIGLLFSSKAATRR